MEDKKFQHPEGKIQLIDGRILDCYPLAQPQYEVNNQLSLDTTGVYLSLKRSNNAKMVIDDRDNEEKELEKLFLDNAFIFLENRKRILSDSRMFLCPLPFSNSGLAYTGTGGFRNPTLGIFIEFWMACTKASVMEANGRKWLVYHIAGSPLSGSNRCGLVNPQGETKSEQVASFKGIWVPFVEINTRYDEAKSKYEAYTLRQVLSIFEDEGTKVAYKKSTHIFFLEQANKELKRRMRSLLELKCEELKAFMTEYKEREKATAYRLLQIRHERLALRKRMKSGEIDNLQYQKLWMPLGKEKGRIVGEMNQFVNEALRTLYPDDTITLSEVKDFLEPDEARER